MGWFVLFVAFISFSISTELARLVFLLTEEFYLEGTSALIILVLLIVISTYLLNKLALSEEEQAESTGLEMSVVDVQNSNETTDVRIEMSNSITCPPDYNEQ